MVDTRAVYTATTEQRLATLADRIAAGVTAFEQHAVRRGATRRRVIGLERRLATACGTLVTTRLTDLDRRIDSPYREIETNARVDAGRAEARRLRIVVAALLTRLVLAVGAVFLSLL